ncbi:hypothetical protein F441_11692, partial [Phytophthora nicotianae CJ01A1]
ALCFSGLVSSLKQSKRRLLIKNQATEVCHRVETTTMSGRFALDADGDADMTVA